MWVGRDGPGELEGLAFGDCGWEGVFEDWICGAEGEEGEGEGEEEGDV